MAPQQRVIVLLLPLLIVHCLGPAVQAFTAIKSISSLTARRQTLQLCNLHHGCADRRSFTDTDGVLKDLFHGIIRPAAFASALALSIVSNQPAFADVDAVASSAVAETTSRKIAYDETWNLIKKYALDQNYNNQNWDEAYKKYSNGMDSTSIDDEERIMKATKNLVGSLGDKYSRILDKSAYAMIQKFDLIGVGATLMPDPVSKEIIIGAPPVPKTAAYEAGLKIGDVVFAVNGVETSGRTAFDIIDQISDSPNAGVVTFTILQKGSNEMRDVTLKRAFQEVKDPVLYRVSETRADGTKVGYIKVVEFNSLVKPKLEAALRDLESQDVNAYVLDVRGNPGGAFQSAVEIAEELIQSGAVSDEYTAEDLVNEFFDRL